ncbi:uncharacterized protein A4U43_C05F16540 [Asparagus officinalis]|uniref:CCHC-type domain-containing protein n=1 Tax=Asparagus officinalis TaxID=4686 RepID=A0A5P1ES19_ASPOF|nr:uncharacterized protein A4U43_C05F16540 [Asparagus officinalis]
MTVASSSAPAQSSSNGGRPQKAYLGKCQGCNTQGHVISQCNLFRQQFPHVTPPRDNNKPQVRMATAAPTTRDNNKPQVRMATAAPTTGAWLMDSGASHHITSDLANLALHHTYDGTEEVVIGDVAPPTSPRFTSPLPHPTNSSNHMSASLASSDSASASFSSSSESVQSQTSLPHKITAEQSLSGAESLDAPPARTIITRNVVVKKNGVGNVADDDGDKRKKMKGEKNFDLFGDLLRTEHYSMSAQVKPEQITLLEFVSVTGGLLNFISID